VTVYAEKAKILIVDDSKNIRRLVAVVLGSDNYDIIEANDGEKALTMAVAHVPDIAIIDVSLPKMNGLEVCDRLRKDNITRNITVLILTSETSKEIKDKAIKCSDMLMHKPFDPAELRTAVKGLLSKSRHA
jgi:DNA-binding response OmpR family regulator